MSARLVGAAHGDAVDLGSEASGEHGAIGTVPCGVESRWTWRMTRDEYRAWRERIRGAVRHREGEDLVQQLIWSLFCLPGFDRLRDQVMALRQQL